MMQHHAIAEYCSRLELSEFCDLLYFGFNFEAAGHLRKGLIQCLLPASPEARAMQLRATSSRPFPHSKSENPILQRLLANGIEKLAKPSWHTNLPSMSARRNIAFCH